MATTRTISAKGVTPEEIAQVYAAIFELPKDSVLRVFIGHMLAGLELGFDQTLILERPEK